MSIVMALVVASTDHCLVALACLPEGGGVAALGESLGATFCSWFALLEPFLLDPAPVVRAC
jgi:hypothetical protein